MTASWVSVWDLVRLQKG